MIRHSRFLFHALIASLVCILISGAAHSFEGSEEDGEPAPRTASATNEAGMSAANAELARQIRGTWFAGQLTFFLDVDSQGAVSGTLSIEGTSTFQVQGELILAIVDPDAEGQPNYDTLQELTLQRQGSGIDPAGGAAGKSAGGLLLGTWISRGTGEGSVELVFASESKLVFDGEEAAYSLVDGAIRLQGETGPVDFPYALSGNTLVVNFPNGERYTFDKISDSVAQGNDRLISSLLTSHGWESFNFSSSSSTTYSGGESITYSYGSSQYRKMYFYPDGTYSHSKSSETSFSGSGSQSGVGSMAGASGGSGTAGRWMVQDGGLYLAQGNDSFRKVDFWIFCNRKSNVNAPSRDHPKGSEPFYYVEGSQQCRCGGWPIVVIFGNEYKRAD
ncbi:MAG: hypothetical protein KJ970_19845 [Candidatus Eisenbacteria bacterium]|uniref:Uncharacterized protein n=1 Tax=Eiseniibacteriota bacterium TaxID=2212470 RepID=A0A948W8C6_UNCEI|nr:hypothetical protein [Candidatus Eisenbacteria bacterium]MBU2693175.1 hypothetical protein [Candidatus Eisenbacteria bacterium]